MCEVGILNKESYISALYVWSNYIPNILTFNHEATVYMTSNLQFYFIRSVATAGRHAVSIVKASGLLWFVSIARILRTRAYFCGKMLSLLILSICNV
jgi:hypothetical protein